MPDKTTAPEPKASAPTETEQKNTAPKVDPDAELKALELEAARLKVAEQKANLEDINERLAERQLKRETVRSRSITNGTTLGQIKREAEASQKRCNHKKGGNGVAGIIGGQGDSTDYAVIKHTFCNGDMWIRCQRCGKTWKPPLEAEYETKEQYLVAFIAYETAVQFQTKNTASSSTQFRFSDGGAYYREVTRDTNLR